MFLPIISFHNININTNMYIIILKIKRTITRITQIVEMNFRKFVMIYLSYEVWRSGRVSRCVKSINVTDTG